MSIFERNPALRWAVPAVTAVALVGGGSAIGGLRATADAGLPARTAAQLLVDVQQARLDGLSGTVVQKSDLGLPDLPISGASGGTGSSDLTSLISGTHTMRVWYAGPDKARMALLGTLGESDVIRNGQDVWVWASQSKTARHYVLPAHDAAGKTGPAPAVPSPSDLPTSPQDAAEKALAAISPSTEVTTSGTARVAGRSAYELVLTPKEATSLVAQVRVAIDGTEHVPLRVQVYAKKVADPVFEVAFSKVDFTRPDAAQFTFIPPPGTTVTDVKTPIDSKTAGDAKSVAPQPNSAGMPTVIGKGWGTVLVVKLPAPDAAASPGTSGTTGAAADKTVAQLRAFAGLLPKVSGAWGSGHLMAGTAFSVLLTDDGRLLVGAVTPEGLYAALAAS
ncbi:MAG: sigma-E factor regulatory protein RseB domain-containing protein [Actinomycetota bacterium]